MSAKRRISGRRTLMGSVALAGLLAVGAAVGVTAASADSGETPTRSAYVTTYKAAEVEAAGVDAVANSIYAGSGRPRAGAYGEHEGNAAKKSVVGANSI